MDTVDPTNVDPIYLVSEKIAAPYGAARHGMIGHFKWGKYIFIGVMLCYFAIPVLYIALKFFMEDGVKPEWASDLNDFDLVKTIKDNLPSWF